jgi:hypothetical protein
MLVDPVEGRSLGVDDVRRHVATHIATVPWLRRTVRRAPGGIGPMIWADDRHFSVDRHVVPSTAACPDEAALTRALSQAVERRLPRDRPLWRIEVLPPLADRRTPLLFSVHHALMDGGLFGHMLNRLFPPEGGHDEVVAEGRRARRASPTSAELVLYAVIVRIGERLRSRRAAPVAAPAPGPMSPRTTPLTGAPGPRRAVATRSVRLADLSRLRSETGATVNDLFVAATTAALRDLLVARGLPLDPPLALIPKDVRSDADDAGNKTWSLHVRLPVDTDDPHRRLTEVRAAMAVAKNATAPAGNAGFLFDVALSSVPLGGGHRLAGALVQIATSAAPLQGHNRLLAVANGHNGVLTIGWTAVAEAFPDVEELAQRTVSEFDHLARQLAP